MLHHACAVVSEVGGKASIRSKIIVMMEAAAAAANTTDEEGEIVTHDDLLEPLEQLSKLRDEVAELVKKVNVENGTDSPVNYDIEQNIREIRAILKMNAEIFGHCEEFMGETKIKTWEDDEDFPSEWCTSFKRVAYEVVTTRARNDGTQIITHPIRTTKEFNTTPLSKLPQGLEDIIVSRKMTGEKISSYIDFEAFFQKSLILHESVLEQFLPKLKEHLMSIQVCLGEIDAWVIQESMETINFLEETFEKKMEIPDDNVILGRHKCSCETHDSNEICLCCTKKYCDHLYAEKQCDRNHPYKCFQCEYYQLLKQCNSDGTFKTTFDITNDEGKAKLKKFLELMAMYH